MVPSSFADDYFRFFNIYVCHGINLYHTHERLEAQAAEAQAAAQATDSAAPPQLAPEVADGPWQDMRYATLEEVKAELVRARGQVFKIQHDTWQK